MICHVNPSTVCDHRIARAFGGTEDDGNLQGICAECDRVKSAREGAVARKRKQRDTLGGNH